MAPGSAPAAIDLTAPSRTLLVKFEDGRPSDTLHLSGFPSPAVETAELVSILSSRGFNVLRSKILPDNLGVGSSAALVQLASQDEASSAMLALNGRDLSAVMCGSASGLVAAQPPVVAAPFGSGVLFARYEGDGVTPSDTVHITGLPSPSVDNSDLCQLLTGLGCRVVRSKVMPDVQGVGSSGALVQVGSQGEAASALKALDGKKLDVVLQKASMQGSSCSASAAVAPDPKVPSLDGILSVRHTVEAGAVHGTMLHISGLPRPAVDAEDLGRLISSLGADMIQSKIIPNTSNSGSSSAIVQISSPKEGQALLKAMHGQRLSTLLAGNFGSNAGGGGVLSVCYAGDGQTPTDTVDITGLPSPAVDQDDLVQLFTNAGCTVLRSRIIADSSGAGSSGAMVQLASQAEAKRMIRAMHGRRLEDILRDPPGGGPVPVAAPSAGRMALSYAGDGAVSDHVHVTGLPSPSVDEGDLQSLFAEHGFGVISSRILPDTRGAGSSAAIIQLGSAKEAARAISSPLNGFSLDF